MGEPRNNYASRAGARRIYCAWGCFVYPRGGLAARH